MKVLRLGWLGMPTANFDATTSFCRDALGLDPVSEDKDFAMFRLPFGEHDYVEVFGPTEPDAAIYTTGPVVGLLVEDLEAARKDLAEARVELIGSITWSRQTPGYGWFHFRGPDGNVYGVLQQPSPTKAPS